VSLLARQIRLVMTLRKSGITDTAVLGAIERVPREVFIPSHFQDQAYENIALPIARGQTISQPLVVALMTQSLKINDRHKVLEIGTGSGYQAAILAKLCRRVYSIERHKPLLEIAEKTLAELRVHNITCKAGDGMLGWKEQAPFDRIIVTAAAAHEAPKPLLDQMSVGGIMVIPMGSDKASQFVYRITRQEDGYSYEKLMPVRFVPLLPNIARDTLPDPVQDDSYLPIPNDSLQHA
jgi:protein-L-isoaspartate(D-aspartate) O-methyltransferase